MLIDLVRQGAAEYPERWVTIDAYGATTYGQCCERAEAFARGLRARRLDRIAIISADTAEIVAALAGASTVGVEACVYLATAPPDHVEALARRFGHKTLVSDRELDLTERPETVSFSEVRASEGELPPHIDRAPLLVLTTGTTGPPRAARHDWSRLIAQAQRRDDIEAARWLLIDNLNQFGGIQVLVHALAGGGTLVVPRSRQPRDVLRAITDHKVTHASATPTMWRMLTSVVDPVAASKLDLRQITLGGEAVPAPLLTRLQQLFPAAKISQVYAATEFGSVVSVADGRVGLPLSVLNRGEEADVQLRIVAGELQARSRVGMLGYHDDDGTAPEWRPTGDLVEVRDGRIHFVGRSTDVINVGGVKVHPLPVEEAVSGVPGVRMVRAYGRPNPITGQVVTVDVVPDGTVETDQLKRAVREGCMGLAAAARPRLIRVVDELGIRGDKIARSEEREQ